MKTASLQPTNYLDILFDGKNKNYGSYELRANYSNRALLAGIIVISVVSVLFGTSLIHKQADVAPIDIQVIGPSVKISEIEIPKIEKIKPIIEQPILKQDPPKLLKTVKNTTVDIVADNKVRTEDKIKSMPTDKDIVGIKTRDDGSLDIDAIHPGLSTEKSGIGTKPLIGNPRGGSDSGLVSNQTMVFKAVEEMPKAAYDFNSYLSRSMKYPNKALEAGIKGTIWVEFIVNVDGKISNVKAVKGMQLGGGLVEEAIRVVKLAPKWKPGKQNNVPVPVYYNVPVKFDMK